MHPIINFEDDIQNVAQQEEEEKFEDDGRPIEIQEYQSSDIDDWYIPDEGPVDRRQAFMTSSR